MFNWIEACTKPLAFRIFCSISSLMDDSAAYLQQDKFILESQSCPALKSPILKDFLRYMGVHGWDRGIESISWPFLVC